jgi:hypothetical protein
VGLIYSVEFSAPPEFSGGVTEKVLSTGWARTFDLQIAKQILYHCTTAPLYLWSYNIHVLVARIFRRFCTYRKPNFLAVSGSYLPGFSGCICRYWQPNFPAVSVVTCRDFLALPILAPEGRDFPAVSVVSGRDSGRSFSGMVNLKKLYGQQANCSGIYSGIFCP